MRYQKILGQKRRQYFEREINIEEKSLRVYSDKKFFAKLTNTITKLLIPTKIGINGMLISAKRNNILKAYEQYAECENEEDKNE